MAKTANLHSLLSDPWFIEENFKQALLPYLGSILNGTPVPDMETHSILFMNEDGALVDDSSASTEDSLVAILPVKNPIFKYDQNCGPMGTQSMMAQMRLWANVPRIKGVVLDMDSGGGQVAGTPEFAAFVNTFQKPVVTYSNGAICSAAMYIAAGSDKIILNEHASCIGSIGTMFSTLDISKKLKKEGISIVSLYAEKSTKKNSVGRAFKEGDYAPIIKEVLNPVNEKFHETILAYRPQLNAEVFTGADYNNLDQAKDYGLFDAYGTLNDAVASVLELSTTTKPKKTEKMSKTYNRINALLGEESEISLKSGLLSSGKAAKLSEEELDTLETRLETLEAENASVKVFKKEATTAKKAQKKMEAAVTAAAGVAEIDEGDTPEETIAALSAEVVRLGKTPGAMGTQTEEIDEEDDDVPAHVDPNAEHNKIETY